MRTVIVNYLAAFDDTKGRAGLRRSPAPGIGIPDRDGIRTAASRKRLSRRRREAYIAVQGIIRPRIMGRSFCKAACPLT